MLDAVAKKLAVITAPAIVALKADRALSALSTYTHVLAGQGAGAGWDPSETDVAAGLVRSETPMIFDVGANNGEWSRRLAERLPKTAEFHLFECAPVCFPKLTKNMAEIERATHVNAAVSDKAGTAIFHSPTTDGVGGGLGSLYDRQDVSVAQIAYQAVETPTIRLDEYARTAGVQAIDLLKMDIEGHELFAMRGAEQLFAERRVKAMTFEFGSANVNSRTFFRDFWDLLTGHGFEISRLVPGGRLMPVSRYDETLEYFRGATNYAATLK